MLSILPTPVVQDVLQFRKDLALNSATSKPYGPADLDHLGSSDPDWLAPVSSSAAAQKYYSSANTDTGGMQKFVPDAGGYPFVQSILSPDNTGKVLWSGAAGKDFQLWKGHATHNEYAMPEQPELDNLLGTEAGQQGFYRKQVTIDPNTQTSFSIFNATGNTVATGLLGLADTITKPIDLISDYTAGNGLCIDLLRGRKQQKNYNRSEVKVPYYSDKDNNHITLQYSASIPAFPVGCGKYLWTSSYYKVSVNSDRDSIMSSTDTIGKDSVLSNNVAVFGISDSLGTDIQKGRYTVSKELQLSEYDIRSQVSKFVKDNEPNCFNDIKYFVRKAVEAADFPCVNEADPDPCAGKRAQMIKELYPGAKYGQYTKISNDSFYAYTPNSIFTAIDSFYTGYQLVKSPLLYGTGVDAFFLPISIGARDPHWEIDTTGSGDWHAAYRIRDFWSTYPIPGPFSYGRSPVTAENGGFKGYAWFRTTINLDSQHYKTLIVDFDGDFGPSDSKYYVNGTLQSTPTNWRSFHPQGLVIGANELKFEVYNTSGAMAVGVRFYYSEDSFMIWRRRYQSTCISLPSSITSNGVRYTRIDTLSTRKFIEIFKDSIAEALLPLHPEYCKLGRCNEGNFIEAFQALATYKQARMLTDSSWTALSNTTLFMSMQMPVLRTRLRAHFRTSATTGD